MEHDEQSIWMLPYLNQTSTIQEPLEELSSRNRRWRRPQPSYFVSDPLVTME
jgi:hypothetical protein